MIAPIHPCSSSAEIHDALRRADNSTESAVYGLECVCAGICASLRLGRDAGLIEQIRGRALTLAARCDAVLLADRSTHIGICGQDPSEVLAEAC